ncbi:MAG: AMP-binding protein [Bryobacteraceae bacterium]|nr:AMP-binding protein [Bryobacteraceae bacterium]
MSPAAASGFDRGAIKAHQLERLRALASAALASNAFYSAKLSAAGVDARIESLHEFSRRVPFTRKAELIADQAKYPPYGSNLTYPESRYTRFSQTSGTTGAAMRWLDTPESWDWMLDCWTRVYQSAGVGPEDRIFFAFSFGPFLGFWTAFEAATRLGCLAMPGGGMRSLARLRTMLDNRATVLCCTPTYAVRLAETAAEEKIDLQASRVRRIIVAGEPGGSIPATRELIERLWNRAWVVDHHGMTEVGPVSYECPARRGALHIMEAAYYPEVIDPETLAAVAPGGSGELILTNLGRTGSPLLRYRTGDLVKRAQESPCRCGSHELALEGGILGRLDDMVVVRGVNVYPSAVEDVLRSCRGVGEYRVEIRCERALPEMSIQVEPRAGRDEAASLAERVAAAMHAAFGLRVGVSCVPSGTLPRFEAKARRWVRADGRFDRFDTL